MTNRPPSCRVLLSGKRRRAGGHSPARHNEGGNIQDIVIILVFAIAIPVTAGIGYISITRKIARSRPPEIGSYQYHMDRYLNSNSLDMDELESALNAKDAPTKMEV